MKLLRKNNNENSPKPLRLGLATMLFVLFFSQVGNSHVVDKITDFRGKNFETTNTTSKIVALMPALAEAIIDLGAGSRLVGAPEYTNIPTALKQHIKILGPYPRLSAEVIHSLKPDIVIASMDGNESTLISQLESLGIQVLVVNTTSLAEISRTLEILTLLTGNNKNHPLLADLNRELARAPHHFKKEAPQVFVQIGWDPLITVSAQTFIGELISKAGGQNIFGQATAKYPKINAEEVIARNPDLIVICRLTPEGNEVERSQSFWKKFGHLKAVRNNRIFVMPMDWLTKPGFALTKGIKELRGRL